MNKSLVKRVGIESGVSDPRQLLSIVIFEIVNIMNMCLDEHVGIEFGGVRHSAIIICI